MKLIEIRHPEYDDYSANWLTWRECWEGGDSYVQGEMVQFSAREDSDDFQERKDISYNPAYAKSLINEIKNSIFQRMPDVERIGGTPSYQAATKGGDDLGVDRKGSSMNSFIGVSTLPEMLVMRKVGLFLDRFPLEENETLESIRDQNKRPYLYRYQAEEILSWVKKSNDEFVSLLLKEEIETSDDVYGLPDGTRIRYRFFQLNDNQTVTSIFFDEEGNEERVEILNIPRIPFHVVEIEESLMEDLAPYNRALMNLASSDMNYALKANFPFYVEQYDFKSDNQFVGDQKEAKVGVAQGRRYAGEKAPEFIHPSPEPLKISMEKQEQMKREMRELLNLKITEMGRRASAESKEMDLGGLQAGLSYFGSILEKAERKVASFWMMYEGSKQQVTINYPRTYDLKTDSELYDESDKLKILKDAVPSKTFGKEVAKLISRKVLGTKVPASLMEKINNEVDKSIATDIVSETIARHVEIGILAKKHAAQVMGYPDDTVDIAQEEHAQRAAEIAVSQAEASARGVADLTNEKNKDKQQDKEKAPEPDSVVRGAAK